MKGISGARWLLGLAILAGLFGTAVTGQDIYFRLLSVGLLVLVISWLWALFSLRGIDVSRRARTLRASVGDVFEERFEVQNASRLTCLWLEVSNESPLPMAAGSRLLTTVVGRQRRSYVARTRLIRRGAFPLGPTILRSGDIFGLFTARRQVPARDMLVVLPMIVPISYFPLPPGLLPGGKAIRQKTRAATPHAAGVREYVPGDPMRHIHWPSTARCGHFMVKEFEQDPQAEVWLFLDAEENVHASLPYQEPEEWADGWMLRRRPAITLTPATMEYGVCIAASLAQYYLQMRRAVGLVVAGREYQVVPAERGERQAFKILEALALLEARGRMTIGSLVEVQARLLPRGSSAVLITPSVRPEILLAAEDLQRRKLRPLVVLLMADSFGGAPGGSKLTESLADLDVPVCSIVNGADLSQGLAQFATGFSHQEADTWPRYPPLPWISNF